MIYFVAIAKQCFIDFIFHVYIRTVIDFDKCRFKMLWYFLNLQVTSDKQNIWGIRKIEGNWAAYSNLAKYIYHKCK